MIAWSTPPGLYTIRIKGGSEPPRLSAFPSMVSELKDARPYSPGRSRIDRQCSASVAQIEALGSNCSNSNKYAWDRTRLAVALHEHERLVNHRNQTMTRHLLTGDDPTRVIDSRQSRFNV